MGFTTSLINIAIATIVGVVLFIAAQTTVASQDTSGWTDLQATIVPLVPTALAIAMLVGTFVTITNLRGT